MIFLATSSIRCPLLGRKCIQSTVTSRPFASESNDRPNSSARLVTLLSSFVKKNSPHSNHRKSTTEPHSSICFCRTNESPTNDIPCHIFDPMSVNYRTYFCKFPGFWTVSSCMRDCFALTVNHWGSFLRNHREHGCCCGGGSTFTIATSCTRARLDCGAVRCGMV